MHDEKTENKKNTMDNGKIRIHCFESTGIEGFPSNTYETDNVNSALECLKDVLTNDNSGISRILIENPLFPESTCYGNITMMSPMSLEQ